MSDLGHEALHVRKIGLATASDREVWAKAEVLAAVVVSKDSDFLGLAVGGGPSLVRLRVGNCSNAVLFDIVRRVWSDVVERLEAGEAIVEVRV